MNLNSFHRINDFKELFSVVECISGLEVTLYLTYESLNYIPFSELPVRYRKKNNFFCKTIKNCKKTGCGGYDSSLMNKKAGEIGYPFINICYAGVAQVILPVINKSRHIASIFIGPVKTEKVIKDKINGIIKKIIHLNVDVKKISEAYSSLPCISEKKLLAIGQITSSAIDGIIENFGNKSLSQGIKINDYPQIKEALEIIASTSSDELSENEIASKLSINQAYFSRLFKKVMNCTFVSYISEYKMNRALNLLQSTDLSIVQIALEIGYSRQSYFNRVFKKFTGLTPSQFRKKNILQ